ncbi:MAG: aminoglycoside phosphotransferase family protein [Chloroflexi bacterium]|nr:aminoglycoside phosphotransferase family protein [Chloroflexota bacterium]
MTIAWPFTTAELTAALRRYLADASLRVLQISEEPIEVRHALGLIRGVGLDVVRADHEEHYSYILKEPQATRLGLAGAGRREVGLYRSLTSQLTLTVPELVASDSNGAWLILEPYPTEVPPEHWTADHYRQAVIDLARLHDRFWNLGEDLQAYAWLGRPLTGDFAVYVMAAAQAMEIIIERGAPTAITDSLRFATTLARLISEAEIVSRFLQSATHTLLHGDYWPGNISIDEDGRHVVYDWQMVSVGPGVMDLLVLINNSRMLLPPLPVEPAELVELYRREIAARTGKTWTQVEWEFLWDFSMMWRFVQEWLSLLAQPTQQPIHNYLLEQIWLEPLDRAVYRWMKYLQN